MNPNLSTSWQRYAFRIMWAGAAVIDLNAYMSIVNGGGQTGYADFAMAQLEEGQVLTGYAPMATELLDGVVSTAKLAANSVVASKIAAGQVQATHISASTIQGSHIVGGTILGTHIAAQTISGSNISFGTLSGTHIAAQTISGTHIAFGTLTGEHILAATISGSDIAAGTISGTHIAFDTLTGQHIQAATISGTHIQAATISGTHIAAGTITTTNLSASSITAAKLAADAIQTLNYSYTGSINTSTEVALSGAKMQASGTALLVAAQNFKIGTQTLEQMLARLAASNYIPGARVPASTVPFGIAETSLPRLVAVGTSYCYTSDNNGMSWTARTIPAGTWRAVAWNGTYLCAVGDAGVIATSPDGITWTISNGSALNWKNIVWTGTYFVILADNLSNISCWKSTTGLLNSWSNTTALPATAYWTGLTWNSTLNLGAAIGYTGGASGTVISTLSSGMAWATLTTPFQGSTPANNMSMAGGSIGNRIVLHGSTSAGYQIYHSTDGTTWNYYTASTYGMNLYSSGMTQGDYILLALGQSGFARGAAAVTSDGLNWKTYDLGGLTVGQDAVWSNGTYGRAKKFYIVGSALSVTTDPNFFSSLVFEP